MSYFVDSLFSATSMIIKFDEHIYQVVAVSLIVSVSAVVIAALVAVPSGIWLALREFTGKRLLLQLLNTLMAMPTVMIGLILYGLLNRQGVLGGLGLLYTPMAVIIGQCCLVIPIIMNLSYTAVQSADGRLLPTLRSLGANAWQQLFWVLSETRYGILIAIVTGFGRAIGEVGAAMMLGGNIQGLTRTMTTAIALETSKGAFELGLALGLLLLSIAFVVNGILLYLQRASQ